MGKVPVMGAGYVDEEAITDPPESSSGGSDHGGGDFSGSNSGTPPVTSSGVNTQDDSYTHIDYESLKTSRDSLNTVAPEDGEINMISDLADKLTEVTKGHDNYLKLWTDGFYVGGGYEVDKLKTCNEDFEKFLKNVNDTINDSPDNNGGVDAPEESSYGGGGGSGTGYEGVGTAPEIDPSGVGSENASPSVPGYEPSISEKLESGSTPEYRLQERTDDYKGAGGDAQLRGSYDTPTSGGSSPSLSGLGGAAAATGGALGTAAAAALGDVGGLGAAGSTVLDNIDYPSGNYTVAQGFAERLTDEEKDEVTKILEEYGYTKEEIEAVLNGEFNTSKILVDRMSKEMQNIIESDPGIRNEILARYGFDIYTETGELDKDKLALALYLDDMNGQDEFSLISMLSDRGVNLVDMDLMGQYSDQLENLLLSNYNIKKLLSDKYGFDFYNLDGSINKDRLILAMLIDEETGTSLLDVINEAATGDVFSTLNTSINSLQRPTPTSSGGGAGLGTAAVLTAAGAAGAIGYAVHKKKKKEKEAEEEEKPDISYSDKTFDIDKYEPDTNEVGTGGSKMSQWVNQAINDAS